ARRRSASCAALAATMLPAHAVGGDFYDYFWLDAGRLGLVIGDVSGKGVLAALYMAMTRTLLRATARGSSDPGEGLAGVNRQLLHDSSSSLFVSLFYGVLDTDSGVLRYEVGGHPWPYLLRGGGVQALEGRGLLVGVMKDAVFETWQQRLRPDDFLLL